MCCERCVHGRSTGRGRAGVPPVAGVRPVRAVEFARSPDSPEPVTARPPGWSRASPYDRSVKNGRFEHRLAELQADVTGIDAVRDWFVDATQTFDRWRIECDDVRDLGDRVLALGTVQASGNQRR